MNEVVLRAGLILVAVLFGYQVWVYLGYTRMRAELDEYESKALGQWRRPLLPLVYEQRAKLSRALWGQRLNLVITGVCVLAMLWTTLKA